MKIIKFLFFQMELSISRKLNKEIESFKKWLLENNYEFNDSNISFIEPKRNKLETYVKEILKNGKIYNDGNEIGDAKLLVKDYKNKNGNKKIKKSNEKKNEIILNMDINTDDTSYLCDMEFTTDELEKIFECKPIDATDKNSRYEWKFEYNGNKYTIYDWCYEDGSFDSYEETEWHLAGIVNKHMDEILEKLKLKLLQLNTNNENENENEGKVKFEFEFEDINFDDIEWCSDEE